MSAYEACFNLPPQTAAHRPSDAVLSNDLINQMSDRPDGELRLPLPRM